MGHQIANTTTDVLAFSLYVAFFLSMAGEDNLTIGALYVLPASWLAWRRGPWGGLGAGLAGLILLELMLGWLGLGHFPTALASQIGLLPAWVTLLVPIGVGQARRIALRSASHLEARRSAEARLRETEILQLATRALGVGVLLVDPEGSIRPSGDRIEELAAPWGDVGAWWRRIEATTTAPCLAQCTTCQRPIPAGATEARLLHPDGTPRFFEVRFAGCGHAVGHDGTLVLIRDTTEAALAHRRLGQARDLALAASQAKNTFLATMSHELRTPLNAIIGYSELLMETIEAPQDRLDLGCIHRQGHHLLRIVSDILDLSRIEAGQTRLELQEAHLGELIGETAELARPLATRHTNRFEVELSAPDQRFLVDRSRLQQVLLNLLSNAFKFTRDGQVRLVARVIDQELVFWVIDTGVGIAREHQERLFEAFYQIDGTTTRSEDGTGMGLAICKRLVDLMGGTLSVESTPGQGSSFEIRIPLAGPPSGAEPSLPGTNRPLQHSEQAHAPCPP